MLERASESARVVLMQVFVLMEFNYGGNEVRGIFSLRSLAAAEKDRLEARERQRLANSGFTLARPVMLGIHEFTLDATRSAEGEPAGDVVI